AAHLSQGVIARRARSRSESTSAGNAAQAWGSRGGATSGARLPPPAPERSARRPGPSGASRIALSACVAAVLCASTAFGQEARGQPVLVLEAPDAAWKDGVQALVAELLTTGRELSVRSARSRSLDELERELELEVAQSAAAAGVSITREGRTATALLCRRAVSPCERLSMEVADPELSRSRLALD